jgi:uncharacterized membrane protein
MTGWAAAGSLVLASFAASLVEFVEALTIVLAVGIVRGWRPALLGAGTGIVLLTALLLALGSALTSVSLPLFQPVVGTLLLMFGLRWLRKAVLRQAAVLPSLDEAEAFAMETERLQRESGGTSSGLDKIGFITTFKAVLLEGIEVVFIVIALGAGGSLLVPAVLGAGLALAVVLGLGAWLHRPLATVPENTLKLGVGILLAAFGTFWVAEGIGLHWPGEDVAIVCLIASFVALAWVLVQVSRRLHRTAASRPRLSAPSALPANRGPLTAAATTLRRLFVDGWLGAGVLAWTMAAWAIEARQPAVLARGYAVFATGVFLVLSLSVVHRALLSGHN